MQNDWEFYPRAASHVETRQRNAITALLVVTLLVSVVSAIVIPGGLGLVAGWLELQEQNRQAAQIHFERGLSYLAEKYPELARSEFEIALKYAPNFEPARQKLAELLESPQETNASAAHERIARAMLDEARALIAQKEWSNAITRLEQLRTLNPAYQTDTVNDLLYQAYVNAGRAAVAAGQIEIARGRFESALAIRNNDPEIKRQRDLAVLYLEGQQAFGFNWQTAVARLSALYQQDPNYGDVKQRLYEAHIQYGDKACKEGAWALAQREYDAALAMQYSAALAQKRAQVQTLCRKPATPTEAPVAASTPPPGSTPARTPTTESYTWITSTARDKACTGAGSLSGTVRDALGRGVPNVAVGYYADLIALTSTRTNAAGQYQFTLGKDAAVLHVVILGADGKTPISLSADVHYPGGSVAGCHIVIEWQKVQ
jgi:tetratricopeptide (TPR) repeat protein